MKWHLVSAGMELSQEFEKKHVINTKPVRIASLAVLAAPAMVMATNGYQLVGVGSYLKSLGYYWH